MHLKMQFRHHVSGRVRGGGQQKLFPCLPDVKLSSPGKSMGVGHFYPRYFSEKPGEKLE